VVANVAGEPSVVLNVPKLACRYSIWPRQIGSS
jgi:hypothetical protein